MLKKIADKAFYVFLILAIAFAVLLPVMENYSANYITEVYAAGEGETMHGESGVDYYRAYRIYETIVNSDGKHKVTYSETAAEIKNILTEAEYLYKKGSSADDLLRRAKIQWYTDSGFSGAVAENISAEKDEEISDILRRMRDHVNDNKDAETLSDYIVTVNALLKQAAIELDEIPVYPVSYYKAPVLDAEYYLSFNAYSKAATAAGITLITYADVTEEIGNLLTEGLRRYASGEEDYYICFTNAYGSWYETSGFEKKVMAYISGSRVTAVELQFAKVKQAAGSGLGTNAPVESIKTETDKLVEMLSEDAVKLDDLLGYNGQSSSGGGLGFATFIGCFTILLREGLEAILIVGAMVAYLIKSGSKDKVKYIYIGAVVAIIASALLAWLLYSLSWTGVPQEIIEGVTALIAVAVLIYVSNWMISKSEAENWNKYISGKVTGSVSTGKIWALGFTSFLAVFREGAEVILFYQPLVSSAGAISGGGWAIAGGIIAGLAAVALVFVLIRVFGVKIPLKPFFMGTSILMAAMSIIFLGSGIWELFIDGGLWPVGIISGIEGWAENDVLNFFGIYPTWLTIIPQIVLLIITVITFMLWIKKGKKDKIAAEANKNVEPEHDEKNAVNTETASESKPILKEKDSDNAKN